MKKVKYNQRVYFLGSYKHKEARDVKAGIVVGREHLTFPRVNQSEARKNDDLLYVLADKTVKLENDYRWLPESCVFTKKSDAREAAIHLFEKETHEDEEGRKRLIRQQVAELRKLGYKITK
jgi:hypothetical protein